MSGSIAILLADQERSKKRLDEINRNNEGRTSSLLIAEYTPMAIDIKTIRHGECTNKTKSDELIKNNFMTKYAIINYNLVGKIDWENEETISVRGSKYYKPNTHIQRIGLIRYYLIRLFRDILEKLESERK